MAALSWHNTGDNKFVTGVDCGAVYTLEAHVPSGGSGTTTYTWDGKAWNGLTSWEKSPEGGEATTLWADNIKYAIARGATSYAGTVSAYTYPENFKKCLGIVADTANGFAISEQEHVPFRAMYRERLYNQNGLYGYRYHVIYGLTCDPNDETAETLEENVDGQEFQFDVQGVPVAATVNGTTKYSCEFTFETEAKDPAYSSSSLTAPEKDANGDTLTTAVQNAIVTLFGLDADPTCPDPNELFA